MYLILPYKKSIPEATEEEVQGRLKAKTDKPKGKSKTDQKTPTPSTQVEKQCKTPRAVATPARSKSTEQPPNTPEQTSGNPALKKRHRSKIPDPDKDRQIAELKKAWSFWLIELDGL